MNDAQSALGRVCGVRARAGTWLGSRRGGIESRGWIHFGEIGRAAHAVARTRTPVSAHHRYRSGGVSSDSATWLKCVARGELVNGTDDC